jgi:hypothetical protein
MRRVPEHKRITRGVYTYVSPKIILYSISFSGLFGLYKKNRVRPTSIYFRPSPLKGSVGVRRGASPTRLLQISGHRSDAAPVRDLPPALLAGVRVVVAHRSMPGSPVSIQYGLAGSGMEHFLSSVPIIDEIVVVS